MANEIICNKNGQEGAVKKEEKEEDGEICSKCDQVIKKLPGGKNQCGCQSEKDVNEEDSDLGCDIRGFV